MKTWKVSVRSRSGVKVQPGLIDHDLEKEEEEWGDNRWHQFQTIYVTLRSSSDSMYMDPPSCIFSTQNICLFRVKWYTLSRALVIARNAKGNREKRFEWEPNEFLNNNIPLPSPPLSLPSRLSLSLSLSRHFCHFVSSTSFHHVFNDRVLFRVGFASPEPTNCPVRHQIGRHWRGDPAFPRPWWRQSSDCAHARTPFWHNCATNRKF